MKNRLSHSSLNIFSAALLVGFLQSMHIWLFWNRSVAIVYLLLLCVCCWFWLKNRKYCVISEGRVIASVLLLLVCFYNGICGSGIKTILISILSYFPAFLLLFLPTELLWFVLNRITRYFSLLLIPSILIYISVSWISIDMPVIMRLSPPIGSYYNEYDCYIFWVRPLLTYTVIWERFNGPFLEPGHLGMICSFLLFANKFDYKKWTSWFLSVSILLTFSLAAYVLFFVGIVFNNLHAIKKIAFSVLIIVVILLGSSLIWNKNKNPVEVMIFNRLKFDEDKGISGNNRTRPAVDKYFQYISSDTQRLLFGEGVEQVKALQKRNRGFNGAGYKIYVLNYGLVGILLLMLFYCSLILISPNKTFSALFVLFLMLSFLQRAYPEWLAWYFPLISGVLISKQVIRNRVVYISK